ncbi:DUF4153 domain-containing protein [Erythrobacter sp. SCSIO 43205]|uniref:DUF4153 domain-containing protein n=1 Tax=Erythrobacter sp. SCSIO 43205 TaxID=2779361 RepID=UPI001CA82F17|nr:DUF4153 domain-containing protein [Erythrobacter sp. SCSIO 43205]UAB79090.1 DUF4153 domain-containing protein [Erythrobacter sp. SCSIO 43205]
MAIGDGVEHAAAQGGAAIEDWRERPWVLAALLGVAGLFVHIFTDGAHDEPWRAALAAFVVFGPLAAAFTLSKESWQPSVIFSAIVGLVMAGIAWRATAAGDRYSDEEFWVAAGVLATTLSVPLFQSSFHKLRWRTSYKETHFHVWTDAITGAGALAFVGLSWALIAILAELFSAIQIDLLKDLIDEEAFGWMFSGVTFGAALGVLRNQLKIIGTLQNVVLLVLSILAVPLAVALVLFLIAVLVSGIDVLWEATKSATPLLLSVAVGCFVLANAVVRDDDADMGQSRVLRVAGFVLALGILPLSVMAAISMGTRIAQHGLSPERIWSLIAIAVAVTYGAAYFTSAIRGRLEGWRDYLRQSNLHLAVIVTGVALLLAMPVFNFGALSASNQLARLQSGAVSVEEFDYAALRWDFGEAGREALDTLVKSDDPKIAELALAVKNAENRYAYRQRNRPETTAVNSALIEVESDAVRLAVRTFLQSRPYHCADQCRVVQLAVENDRPIMALLSSGRDPEMLVYNEADNDISIATIRHAQLDNRKPYEVPEFDADSVVELRPFTGQQLYIDGKPASGAFR